MTQYAGNAQLRRLLDAVMAVSTDLELEVVLERITGAARELVDARYAALGVLDETRTSLAAFITVGMSDEERAAIGALPKATASSACSSTNPSRCASRTWPRIRTASGSRRTTRR